MFHHTDGDSYTFFKSLDRGNAPLYLTPTIPMYAICKILSALVLPMCPAAVTTTGLQSIASRTGPAPGLDRLAAVAALEAPATCALPPSPGPPAGANP